MESLSDVATILRYDNRHELSSLLAGARVDFEVSDWGFSRTTDAISELCTAVIYAPIPACKKLRALSKDDDNVILNALRDVWPFSEGGGMVIQGVVYRIDPDSFGDDTSTLFTSPVGWERVDRTRDRIRELLRTASAEEQFQEVGLLCRDGLISMAQAVFDHERHPPTGTDNVSVSDSDVKRMIARYVASECPGASNQEVRKCVNSAMDLANKVTHGRGASYRDAALCAQATFNAIGLIEIISGRRDREELRPPVAH